MIEEKGTPRKHPCESCPAFKDSFVSVLTKSEIAVLKENAPSIIFRKGQKMVIQDEPGQGVFCIRSGIVKLFEDSDQASSITLGFRKTGNLIGYHGLVNGENVLSATCMTPVEACFFSRKSMLPKTQETPKLLEKINSLLIEEMKEMIGNLTSHYAKSVEQRLIMAMLKLEEKFGTAEDGFIAIPLTRLELAQYVGASIEAVFRALAMLKKRKWIEVKKEKIKIIEKMLLRSLLK